MLQKALAETVKLIEPNSSLDILRHVLLRSTGTTISISATNLDTWVTATVFAQLPVFETCVLPKYLQAAVKKGGKLNLTPKEKTLEISTSNLHIIAPTLSKDEFPKAPEFKTTGRPISGDILKDIAKLAPIASTDETRLPINGVRLDTSTPFRNTKGWIIATDGRRLTAVKPESELPFEGTLSNKAVEMLQTISDTGACSACRDDEKTPCAKIEVETSWGTYSLQTKLINATFPDWTYVMTAAGNTITQWDAHGLLPEFETLNILGTPDNLKRVLIKITPTGTSILQQEAEIQTKHIQLIKGTPTEIAFRKDYLENMCALFGPSPFLAFTNKPTDPITANDGKTFHILMPIRIPQ